MNQCFFWFDRGFKRLACLTVDCPNTNLGDFPTSWADVTCNPPAMTWEMTRENPLLVWSSVNPHWKGGDADVCFSYLNLDSKGFQTLESIDIPKRCLQKQSNIYNVLLILFACTHPHRAMNQERIANQMHISISAQVLVTWNDPVSGFRCFSKKVIKGMQNYHELSTCAEILLSSSWL